MPFQCLHPRILHEHQRTGEKIHVYIRTNQSFLKMEMDLRFRRKGSHFIKMQRKELELGK